MNSGRLQVNFLFSIMATHPRAAGAPFHKEVQMRKRIYLSRELRMRIIKKYNATCFYCGKKGCVDKRMVRVIEVKKVKKHLNTYDGTFIWDDRAFHFDHHVSLFLGGDNTFENLVLSCEACNLKRGKGVRLRRNNAVAQI